ncbi:hypothetical protein CRM22_006636 [Opisthorchis felineus]|uniref:MARVEL domain-containing protein n=1 Tax=Opisthorchis felineus TaxID=147828 RepID=A0A4V6RGX8_OPIFE|nr:hypothetical protein CRM22_006636 [Opisthorchis felineus]
MINSLNGSKRVEMNVEGLPDAMILKKRWKYYEGYFKTFPAVIRIAEMIFMLIAFSMSCVANTLIAKGGPWLVIVTIVTFMTSFLFMIFHLFLLHRFLVVPWTLIEFITDFIICILIFSSGVLSAAHSHTNSVLIAQTVFMFLALALYVIDGLVAFKIVMAGKYYERINET